MSNTSSTDDNRLEEINSQIEKHEKEIRDILTSIRSSQVKIRHAKNAIARQKKIVKLEEEIISIQEVRMKQRNKTLASLNTQKGTSLKICSPATPTTTPAMGASTPSRNQ